MAKGSGMSMLMTGLGNLLMTWLQCVGIEPRICTNDEKFPCRKDESFESWTICSVSTSLATSP
jgi:hypothetical protein